MKQIIWCCLMCMSLSNGYAQTVEKIVQKYTVYDSVEVTEKVYVQTDQTLYAPNDDIWFNVFAVDAENRPSRQSETLYAELYRPDGSLEKKVVLYNKGGHARGVFKLGANAASGEYKIKAYSYWMQNFEKEAYFEKKITVQKVLLPEVLMKIDFEREAYGAGDKVIVHFEAKNKKDKALANYPLTYTVKLGDEFLCRKKAITDENGAAVLVYELPEKLSTTDNLVNIQFKHNGLNESIARSAPIVLGNLDLQLLPEGGNVIANQPNRIAIKVLNEFGQPADVKAEIINKRGGIIGTFETFHQGMGAFDLTPEKGEVYQVRVTQPIGIRQKWTVPSIDENKLGIYVKEQTKASLMIDVYSYMDQPVFLLAKQQGNLIYTKKIAAKKGANHIELSTNNLPVGIVQLTLLDVEEQVHAERLVFVNKDRKLTVSLKTDKKQYAPRELVEMDLTIKDELGKGVQGNFSMAVVDDKQHAFVDDKQDNILSYLLMSSDLKGAIYEPSFYFDPKEKKANEALDYVLLTHGWSRLNWTNILTNQPRAVFPYPFPKKEIAGYLKIGNQLGKNQTVFLSKDQARYTKKKALATTQTGENGFFKFNIESLKTEMPLYLSANYHGEYYAKRIYNYSKAGMLAEAIIPIYYEQELNLRGYYKNKKDGKLYDRNNKKVAVIKGNIVDEREIVITNTKGLTISNGIIYDRSNNEVSLDTEGFVYGTDGLLSERQVNPIGITKFELKEIVTNKSSSPIEVAKANKQLAEMAFKEAKKQALRAEQAKVGAIATKGIGPMIGGERDITQIVVNRPFSINRTKRSRIASREVASLVAVENRVGTFSQNNRYNVNSTIGETFIIENNLYIGQLEELRTAYTGIREYYHPNYKNLENPRTRTDFRKTVYWNPELKTDKNGKTTLSYYNSDEVTTFRAILEGNTTAGKLVHHEATYYTVLPFNIVTKIPTVLSFGDTIDIPVVLNNNSSNELKGAFTVDVPSFLNRLNTIPTNLVIPGNSHKIVYLKYQVGFEHGKGTFIVHFKANELEDSVEELVTTTSKGFPVSFAMSGQQLKQTDTLFLEDKYKGSLTSKLTIYHSVLDGLMDCVSSILRSPSGCFEQVSSSNYPNVLALKLMDERGELNGRVRKKALAYLASGYDKLTAYEIEGGGFEWYGRAPAHEGLTAYGLVQFKEMESVYDGIEPAVIERTQNYLLSRRNGKGGFLQNVGKYGFSGNKKALFNAYITWALSEAKTQGIQKEVEAMTKEAINSEDLYRMSLAALTHFNIGNKKQAEDLQETIQNMLLKVGLKNVKAESSVTYSYGNALNIETLSFAALVMIKSDQRNEELLVKIIQYLIGKRANGRFGSTQSTVMALKTLTAYSKLVSKQREDKQLRISINNELVVDRMCKKEEKNSISITDLHKHFVDGQNIITIEFDGSKQGLAYSFDANWTSKTPASHKECPVLLNTVLKEEKAVMGETVRLEIRLKNKKEEGLPSTMAVVGIPAGLSVQPWQLKELQEKQAFAYYEMKDNYLILYYRSLDAKEEKVLSFDLKTEVPGVYVAPASTAYLYYGDEYKYWTAGTVLNINKDR